MRKGSKEYLKTKLPVQQLNKQIFKQTMLEIKSNFWDENGRTLCKPDLRCLRQDHEVYKTMLMQLVGKIEYDNNGIKLSDKNLATAKFNLFIDKAIAENVDLAITPEYSCPWTSIESFISENKLPPENKIWILGCQSIKPKELKAHIDKNENVIWVYDKQLVEQNINEEKFFDPVCIFFKTKNANDEIKNVVIVQFKTHGFGGNEFEWERDNCIAGQTLYVIENHRPSTRLVTIICSDTLQGLDFNTMENEYFKNSPLLLVHIQLNQKPFQSNYKIYRTLLFSKGKEDLNKEVICLNWAKGVSYDDGGRTKIFNTYGGSALYLKTNKIVTSDERINHNHTKGLYYTSWGDKKSHIYFLNYDEGVFLIESTKPSQINSDATQMLRTGPKILKTFAWDSNWLEIPKIGDGFSQVCSEIEDATGNLTCLTGNSNFTDVERIIQLSVGEIDYTRKEKWSEILNLFSFQVSDTEINYRNTFTQDPDILSIEKRKDKIGRYHFLKNSILKDPDQVPASFADAIVKFDEASGSKNIYLLNLHSPTTGRRGTAIYIGVKTLAQANAFKVKIESLFNEDQQGKQVMVWYNSPNLQRIYEEDNKPGISENVSQSPVSYKKTN